MTETPTPRVRKHIVTAVVAGKTRHRVLGLSLRFGQTAETLDLQTRQKLIAICKRYGLDLSGMRHWWWYEDASPEEPVPDHRLKRGDVVIQTSDRGGAEFSSMADPLTFYFRRGHIDAAQYQAGLKLYQLWRWGNQLSSYRVMRYDDAKGGMADSHAKALLSPEYRKAADSIRSPKHRAMAYSVCCEGYRAGGEMGVLIESLDDLAAHFAKGASRNKLRERSRSGTIGEN